MKGVECKTWTSGGGAVNQTRGFRIEGKASKRGLLRGSWLDIFSMWSGRGRYLLKGFFQRSIFRAGVCKKGRENRRDVDCPLMPV